MPRRKKVEKVEKEEITKEEVKEVEVSTFPSSLVVDLDFDTKQLKSYKFKDCGVVYKSGKAKKRYLVISKK